MYAEEEPKNGGPRRATESQEGNAGCVVAGAHGLRVGRLRERQGGVWELQGKQASRGGLFRSRDCLARSGALPGEPLREGGGQEAAARSAP